MNSILTSDIDFLYKILNEADDELKDMHISGYKADYLSAILKQVNLEIKLRSFDMSYQKCHYRHENGNCAAIGGFCTSNGQGNALDLCQKARKTYIETINMTKGETMNGNNAEPEQNAN
mgnify:CR=1 FL=1